MVKRVCVILIAGSLASLIMARDIVHNTIQTLSTIQQQLATQVLYWHQIWVCHTASRQVMLTLMMNHHYWKVNSVALFSSAFHPGDKW